MRRISWLLALMLVTPLSAQERYTEHTLQRPEGTERPSATIEQMAWLAGHWRGSGLGGECEEMWTPPVNGTMLGSFRFMKDGEPIFYELLTLSEKEGSLTFRLKHFNPDLTGWEEKADFVEFEFVADRDGVMHFDGMSFHRDGDSLMVYLAIGNDDGSLREEVFRYTRVGSAPGTLHD